MTPERPRRPGKGGGGGRSDGVFSHDETTAHLAEVAVRLRAIMPLTDLQWMNDDIAVADRLAAIKGLTGWAAVHLAVVREHGEAA